MAVHAAVSRQMYPIGAYHTTQAASTASIHASHQDVQARGMYGQSFGFPHQMFAYPHYPITAQAAYATHAPPQNYSPVSPPGSAVLLSQQNPSTLHSSPSQGIPASPRLKLEQPPYSHMKVEPASYHHLKVEPPYSQLKAEQSAFPHMKVEQSSFPQMKTESASYPQLKVEQSTSSAASSSGSGPNTNAAPGPIPATTPLVVRQDQNGVQWIAFEYSRDRVKMEYCIRCDVESVAIDDLTLEFKAANCVYPGAYSGKEGYKGNRLHYESECNAVGWALAHLNPALREKRGLIQRAVDSWRNSNQDPRLRSRRVRRQAKINNRKAQMRQPGTPVSLSAAEVLAGNRLPPAVPVGSTRPTPLNVSAGQLHHHHSTSEGTGSEGVSVRNEVQPFLHRHSPPGSQPLSSPVEARRRDSHCPSFSSTSTVSDSQSLLHTSQDWIKEEEDEKKATLFGDVPEGKKRKFILVDDFVRGTRVRVHVELDNIKMEEMPDFHLRKNSVFPRSFFPRQMRSPSGSPGCEEDRGYDSSAERENSCAPSKDERFVSVSLLDGSQADLPVPRLSKTRRVKECALNELGYRMSWRQAKTFNERTIFMQKSLDAYRDKMRSAMVASGQDCSSIAAHFEVRTGKRKWSERRSVTENSL